MYPNLSYFFKDVFGLDIPLPIQTYGFFVALAFLAGGFMLSQELKRKEKEGIFKTIQKKILVGEPATAKELIIAGIIGFLIGFKLLEAALNYTDFVDNPQDFILSSRGHFLGGIIGAGISIYMSWKEKNKQKLDQPKWITKEIHPYQLTGTLLVFAGIFGLLGAKIFHNLENMSDFLADPIGSIFSFSGLTFLGGLILGSSAVLYLANKNGMKPLHMLDIAAVGVPLAYAVGRIACHVAGDGCWGIPNPAPQPDWLAWLPEWTWHYNYPHNVINDGIQIHACDGKHCRVLDVPVWPTSLYESLMSMVIFAITMAFHKIIKIPGILFSMYLFLGGIERFTIEQIRINTKYDIMGGITQAEIISSLMALSGILLAIFLFMKAKKNNVLEK